jgi:hypothetical protein
MINLWLLYDASFDLALCHIIHWGLHLETNASSLRLVWGVVPTSGHGGWRHLAFCWFGSLACRLWPPEYESLTKSGEESLYQMS